MKSFIILTLSLFTFFQLSADLIVFKDGRTQEIYNVEESGKWILYTLSPDPDSELKRVEAESVFAIKPENGEMIMVGNNDSQSKSLDTTRKTDAVNNSEKEGPKYMEPNPASDNSQKIAAYNNVELRLKKPKKENDKTKYCSDFISIWGIGENSILSDENIDISLEAFEVGNARNWTIYPYYKIKITNKTINPVYIDLANSFRVNANGISTPYFTNSVYTEGTSKSKGSSMNLGAVAGAMGVGGAIGTLASGINVGKGSTKSASISTEEQRFLMIPPMAAIYMPPIKFSEGDKIIDEFEVLYLRNKTLSSNPLTSEGDLRRFDEVKPYFHAVESSGGLDKASFNKDNIQAPMGWVKDFSEEESPKTISRLITYSTSPDFETYTTIPIILYIRGVMGSNERYNVPKFYDRTHLESSDDAHLLWGFGSVKKN
ncbi:MAG: hypothetical protein J1F16_03050 [Muribaculaceae bacterium]|nr:hypothetical protein [Muribaculaceae bacterium]